MSKTLSVLSCLSKACSLPVVGGQAVMEGILMRNGASYALAVRRPSGAISVEKRNWRTVGPKGLRSKKFLRGFPILVETLSNGIHTLLYGPPGLGKTTLAGVIANEMGVNIRIASVVLW